MANSKDRDKQDENHENTQKTPTTRRAQLAAMRKKRWQGTEVPSDRRKVTETPPNVSKQHQKQSNNSETPTGVTGKQKDISKIFCVISFCVSFTLEFGQM